MIDSLGRAQPPNRARWLVVMNTRDWLRLHPQPAQRGWDSEMEQQQNQRALTGCSAERAGLANAGCLAWGL